MYAWISDCITPRDEYTDGEILQEAKLREVNGSVMWAGRFDPGTSTAGEVSRTSRPSLGKKEMPISSGTAWIGEVRTEDLVLSDLKSAVAGNDGFLDLNPVTMLLFGGEGSIDFSASLSTRGKTANKMKRIANGAVSLRG